MLATPRCDNVFAAQLGIKVMLFMTQCQASIRRSRLVKTKLFCATFKAVRKFTITDYRSTIYFSAISVGSVNQKCAAMLIFIKMKYQL